MKGKQTSSFSSIYWLAVGVVDQELIRFRVEEEEIEEQTDKLRKKLAREGGGGPKKGLKMHQVHELAEAKIKQDDRFRSALGISKNYEEGGHWKKQEEKKRKEVEEQQATVKGEGSEA